MQTQGGQAVADAIESNERYIRARVTVDWNGVGHADEPLCVLDDWIDTVSVDRSLKGAAPAEILLVEGSSAAELNLTLSGEYNHLSLVEVFSRFNPASPLYGKRTVGATIRYSLIVDAPLGSFEYPQFIGDIRTINPSRSENTVAITALDLVERLRKPITLSKWAMHDSSVRWGEIDSQVCWSHSIIDMALRQCDVSPGPKRPTTRYDMNVPDESYDGTQFFLTANGSYVPVVGWLEHPIYSSFPNRGKAMYTNNVAVHPDVVDDPESEPLMGFKGVGPVDYGGGWPAAQNREGYLRYHCTNRDWLPYQGTYYMGLTLNNPNEARAFSKGNGVELFQIVAPWCYIFRIWINDGYIWSTRTIFYGETQEISDGMSSKVAIPAGTSPIDVFVQWDNTSQTGSKVYVRVGNNTNANGGWQSAGTPMKFQNYLAGYNIKGRISVCNIVDMSDIFLSARNYYQTTPNSTHEAWRPAKYPAVLDRGLNRLSHVPVNKPTEAWQIITDVAAAEFGAVFWDENGVFRFWNQERIVQKQGEIVRRITLDDLSQLNLTDTLDSVRNVFTIEARKARAQVTTSVYSSSDEGEFETPANSTRKFITWADNVISPNTTIGSRYQGTQGSVSALAIFQDGVSHGYVLQGYFPPGSQYGEGWYEHNNALQVPWVYTYLNNEGFLVVQVENPNNVNIRFAKGLYDKADDDSPALNVGGTKMAEFPSQTFTVQNKQSIDRYGAKTLALSGPWYQDSYAANNMISTLMKRTAAPIPVTDDITIPGDPRLQLADTILLDDDSGYGVDIPAQILGINRVFSKDDGLTDNLTIEVVQPSDGDALPSAPPGTNVERTNLCLNPRLQANRSGWFGSTGDPGRQVTDMTDFPGTSTGFVADNQTIMPRADVEGGKNYTFSVWCMPEFTGYITVSVDWYKYRYDGDEEGNFWGSAGEKRILVYSGQLTRLSMSVTAPSGVQQAPFIARYSGTAYFSQALYEEGVQLYEYFDGDTSPPDTIWTGTPGNSISKWLIQGDDDDDGETPDDGDGGEGGYVLRRNLCTNPALGANSLGYDATSDLTIVRVTGLVSSYRSTGLRVTGSTNDEGGVITPFTEEVEAGKTYIFSVEIRNDGSSVLDGELQIHCKGTGGAWYGAYGDSQFSIAPSAVSRIATQPFALPAGTTNINGYITKTTGNYTLTAVMYEETNIARDYFDGDSPNATWDGGVRYNSTSTYQTGGSTPVEPPPGNEPGSAAAVLGWGTPVAWDTFNYSGAPKADVWSVYGNGGNVGGDDKQCWAGHAGNGRRCVEETVLNGSYLRLNGLPNGDAGAISHRFGQRYGRWEVKARVGTSGSGSPYHAVLIIWPDSEEWPEDGEYDFFEVTLNNLNTAEAWLHYPHVEQPGGAAIQEFASKSGVDLTQWHLYAFEWTSAGITGFIDGVQWFTYSGVSSEKAALGASPMQNMSSGHLTMQVDNFGSTQQSWMDVEYVRVYDLAGEGPDPAPDGWKFFVDVSYYQKPPYASPGIDLESVRDLGYAGCIARIGQGAGSYVSGGETITHGQLIDTAWDEFRTEALTLWPFTTAGYWYIGNTETPASQATRCYNAIGSNKSLPIMMDWEDGSGNWANFLAVLDAFRTVGLNPTMLYTRKSYADANGVNNVAATGLSVIASRYYWDEVESPRVQWDDKVDKVGASWGFETIGGVTPKVQQFTSTGRVYTGMVIDVSAFQGTDTDLYEMMHGI